MILTERVLTTEQITEIRARAELAISDWESRQVRKALLDSHEQLREISRELLAILEQIIAYYKDVIGRAKAKL